MRHPLERGSATAGGAKARRMLLAAETLLRCHQTLLYPLHSTHYSHSLSLLSLPSSPLLYFFSSSSCHPRRSLTVQPVHPEALGLLGEILGDIELLVPLIL
jgi:hypothetical protein